MAFNDLLAEKLANGSKFDPWDIDAEALTAAERFVAGYDGDFEFVLDLKRKLGKGRLSAGQAKGALNVWLANSRRALAAARPTTPVNLAPIVAFLDRAATTLKWPKFHFVAAGESYVLRRNAHGLRVGAVNIVSEEKYWDDRAGTYRPRWFGRIDPDGTLVRGGQLTLAMEAALVEIATDPVAAATSYAKFSGACSFCGKELTDARSLSVAYGPVCAKKYGLPWGAPATEVAAIEAPAAPVVEAPGPGDSILDSIKVYGG